MIQGLILAALLAFFSAFFGGYINLRGQSIGREGLRLTNGFSAGLLITIALAHMLPEANLEKNYLYAVTGFGIFYLIEGLTRSGSCANTECEKEHKSGGVIAFVGLSFHALVDGVAMGVGFGASTALGVLIAIAIMVHKAPMGFTLTGILNSKGLARVQILLLLIIFAFLTPLGALLSGLFITIKFSIIQSALAFSGGTFLHISVSELLPDVHRDGDKRILLYVVAGILVGLLPKAIHLF